MKKKALKTLCMVTLIGAMISPVTAFAHNNQQCEVRVEYFERTDLTISPRADIKQWVHTTINGLVLHRLWNRTQGYYEGPWYDCDCE